MNTGSADVRAVSEGSGVYEAGTVVTDAELPAASLTTQGFHVDGYFRALGEPLLLEPPSVAGVGSAFA